MAAAEAAARNGDWVPAADLLTGISTDWDQRAFAVRALGDAAADDDSWLRAWRAARPDDPDVAVVHADGLVALAWQIRSSARAEHVSSDQFAGFFRTLEEAETAALAASELAPADPTPWRVLLTTGRGRQLDNDAFRERWAELVARDPLHRGAHDQALQYWCHKWFGSDELMFEFAEQAAVKSPSLSILPVVAAFEAEAREVKAWQHERTRRALDQALRWLNGDGANHPSTRNDRAYAALALVENKRYDEAVEQFRHLGTHADAIAWAYSGKPLQKFFTTRFVACANATPPAQP
ncbi:DUF4034 domain-containing protein [Amycolatopsis sp. H20-H5]|uniref:DUF4034 domain-containing protein n=1 Tax=Amycolatopsis sp. H20-H5 TaxID=3046309 RepID=UPI002DB7D9C1|nr:DUF4034 domain-containing protein [Amycolatopsis sp. H20-H5]MEC3975109.1 DUF4034 domain-containing protein [Amycolatopsis sp. H20-H5]